MNWKKEWLINDQVEKITKDSGIANEKKKPKARRRRKSDQRGGITVPDLLLAKMISNDNRNWAQRDAIIDTMNKSHVRRMGKFVDFF